jgi:hypothetical protein
MHFSGISGKEGHIVVIRCFVEENSIERTIVVEDRKPASGL